MGRGSCKDSGWGCYSRQRVGLVDEIISLRFIFVPLRMFQSETFLGKQILCMPHRSTVRWNCSVSMVYVLLNEEMEGTFMSW